jgi:hypothetical protein
MKQREAVRIPALLATTVSEALIARNQKHKR